MRLRWKLAIGAIGLLATAILTVAAWGFYAITHDRLSSHEPGVLLVDLVARPLAWWAIVTAVLATMLYAIGSARAEAARKVHEARAEIAQRAEDKRSRTAAEQTARAGFAVQLVAAQLISPITQRAYQLELNLRELLNAGPYAQAPKVVWAPVDNTARDVPVAMYAGALWDEGFRRLQWHYVFRGRETASGESLLLWKDADLSGQPIFFATTPKIPLAEARELAVVNPELTMYLTPQRVKQRPQAHVDLGGPAVGFDSLERALDYLQANPDRVVWLGAVDCPEHPKFKTTNEAAILLMLAHPSRDTGRKPLAWIHRPVRASLRAGETAGETPVGKSERVTRWKALVERATGLAQTQPKAIGTLLHDAGDGTDESSARLGTLAQTMTELAPDFEFLPQSINLPRRLGDLGATTVAYNVLLGSYAAYARNRNVLVAGTSNPNEAAVIVIRPPANHAPPPADKSFPYASGAHQFNRLWWGERLDGRRDP
jgi:hypothetical protein